MKRCFEKLIFALSSFLLISSFIFHINIYAASDRIVPNGMGSLFDTGPGFASELVVTGDSYAERFYVDEKDRGIKMYPFFHEGRTLEENWPLLVEAFKSLNRFVFVSISVNDRHRKTHPSDFEREFRELLDIARSTEKKVFLHSYMYYDLASIPIFPYTTFEYDAVMRKLTIEYQDVVYFIDMSDCVSEEYKNADGIHYNKKFNDTLYDRLNFMIDYIRKQMYE